MELHEKIKFLRHKKSWSQEKVAHQLGISVNGYGNIERGETDIPLSRLRKVAEVFGVDLAELFCSKEMGVLNLACTQNHTQWVECIQTQSNWHVGTNSPEHLKHEIEKQRGLNEQKDSEINHLKNEIAYLKQIIALYEKNGSG
jgi:transcriptional regulator with XRE-family HTH domain